MASLFRGQIACAIAVEISCLVGEVYWMRFECGELLLLKRLSKWWDFMADDVWLLWYYRMLSKGSTFTEPQTPSIQPTKRPLSLLSTLLVFDPSIPSTCFRTATVDLEVARSLAIAKGRLLETLPSRLGLATPVWSVHRKQTNPSVSSPSTIHHISSHFQRGGFLFL